MRGLQVHHRPVAGGRRRADRGQPRRRGPRDAGAGRGPDVRAGHRGDGPAPRGARAPRRPRHAGFVPAREPSAPGRPPDGTRVRLHLGTAAVDAIVGRRGARGRASSRTARVGAILRLAGPVATFVGDRGVLRRPSPGDVVAGFVVLDPRPARGIAPAARDHGSARGARRGRRRRRRRRRDADALVALHGAVVGRRVRHLSVALGRPGADPAPIEGGLVLAPDVRDALETAALAAVATFHRERPLESGLPFAALRTALGAALRRLVAIAP